MKHVLGPYFIPEIPSEEALRACGHAPAIVGAIATTPFRAAQSPVTNIQPGTKPAWNNSTKITRPPLRPCWSIHNIPASSKSLAQVVDKSVSTEGRTVPVVVKNDVVPRLLKPKVSGETLSASLTRKTSSATQNSPPAPTESESTAPSVTPNTGRPKTLNKCRKTAPPPKKAALPEIEILKIARKPMAKTGVPLALQATADSQRPQISKSRNLSAATTTAATPHEQLLSKLNTRNVPCLKIICKKLQVVGYPKQLKVLPIGTIAWCHNVEDACMVAFRKGALLAEMYNLSCDARLYVWLKQYFKASKEMDSMLSDYCQIRQNMAELSWRHLQKTAQLRKNWSPEASTPAFHSTVISYWLNKIHSTKGTPAIIQWLNCREQRVPYEGLEKDASDLTKTPEIAEDNNVTSACAQPSIAPPQPRMTETEIEADIALMNSWRKLHLSLLDQNQCSEEQMKQDYLLILELSRTRVEVAEYLDGRNQLPRGKASTEAETTTTTTDEAETTTTIAEAETTATEIITTEVATTTTTTTAEAVTTTTIAEGEAETTATEVATTEVATTDVATTKVATTTTTPSRTRTSKKTPTPSKVAKPMANQNVPTQTRVAIANRQKGQSTNSRNLWEATKRTQTPQTNIANCWTQLFSKLNQKNVRKVELISLKLQLLGYPRHLKDLPIGTVAWCRDVEDACMVALPEGALFAEMKYLKGNSLLDLWFRKCFNSLKEWEPSEYHMIKSRNTANLSQIDLEYRKQTEKMAQDWMNDYAKDSATAFDSTMTSNWLNKIHSNFGIPAIVTWLKSRGQRLPYKGFENDENDLKKIQEFAESTGTAWAQQLMAQQQLYMKEMEIQADIALMNSWRKSNLSLAEQVKHTEEQMKQDYFLLLELSRTRNEVTEYLDGRNHVLSKTEPFVSLGGGSTDSDPLTCAKQVSVMEVPAPDSPRSL